jgi:hypothetical protein
MIMTSKEKLNAIKKAEQEFFYKVSLLKRDYRQQIKKIAHEVEEAKLAQVKKHLGMK